MRPTFGVTSIRRANASGVLLEKFCTKSEGVCMRSEVQAREMHARTAERELNHKFGYAVNEPQRDDEKENVVEIRNKKFEDKLLKEIKFKSILPAPSPAPPPSRLPL